jgi:tetratricopeptide (TPR) repeat protein
MVAALRAVQLDEKNPYSHYALAITSVFAGALEQAERAAEKSIEISPSFALGHLVLGMARLFSGRASEAIEPLDHGLRLSPYDPQNFVWFCMLALALHFSEHPDEALQAALKALKVRPAWQPTLEIVALCYAALDRFDEAREVVEKMRQVDKPEADLLAGLKTHNAQWAESMAAMLRKASLPE